MGAGRMIAHDAPDAAPWEFDRRPGTLDPMPAALHVVGARREERGAWCIAVLQGGCRVAALSPDEARQLAGDLLATAEIVENGWTP